MSFVNDSKATTLEGIADAKCAVTSTLSTDATCANRS